MKLVKGKDGYRKVGDKYLLAKKCTCCGRWLVASTANFYKHNTGRYGLESRCKECKKSYDKQWQQANRDKKAENNKKYHEANKERIAEHRKQYYEKNKEKIRERRKQYRENNKEKIRERNKKYHKQWYEANREKALERAKQYRQSPQGQVVKFNEHQRRRTKEEQQGSGITKDQWLELMSFFDWKCAYSGEYIGGKQNYQRTIDHIVPLNSGGDNMVWNMVPMARSLNSSKCVKDMLEWYKEQDCYSEARLAKIYEWQEYARKKWKK